MSLEFNSWFLFPFKWLPTLYQTDLSTGEGALIYTHTKSEWFARVFGEHEQPCLYKEGLDLTWDRRGRGYSDRQLQNCYNNNMQTEAKQTGLCGRKIFETHKHTHLLCLFMISEAYWVVQEHSVFMRQRKWMQIRVLGERFLLIGFVFVSAPPTGSCGTSPLKVFRHLWLDISLSSLSQKRWISVRWTMQNVQNLQGGTTCLWVQQKFRRDVQRQMLNPQILIWVMQIPVTATKYLDEFIVLFLIELHRDNRY